MKKPPPKRRLSLNNADPHDRNDAPQDGASATSPSSAAAPAVTSAVTTDRGGRKGALRTCVVTRAEQPPETLVRFARSPDGVATPDIAARLPGRGVWVTADRATIAKAAAKGHFARGFKAATQLPDGASPEEFADSVAMLLTQRLLRSLGLLRRSGMAAPGFEQARELLKSGKAAFVLSTSDAAEDGAEKLRKLATALAKPGLRMFTTTQASSALGLDGVRHIAVKNGGGAKAFLADARRLGGFAPVFASPTSARSQAPAPTELDE